MIRKVYAVYFSAVENTKKTAERIAETAAGKLSAEFGTVDFTLPAARAKEYSFGPDDLVVFGTPTYAGRVPNKVLPFVQTLFHGNGTPVIPVVTFGNRSFDSSLSELTQELQKNGFLPFAAGAFACRHVFSDVLAAGRPDGDDFSAMEKLAEDAVNKLEEFSGNKGPERDVFAAESARFTDMLLEQYPVGPYYTPLGTDGKPAVFLKSKPFTDESACDGCGICAKVCPMGSIDPSDVLHTAGICIKCHACIRKCPKQARRMTDEAFLSHKEMLEKSYLRRAEPAVFL